MGCGCNKNRQAAPAEQSGQATKPTGREEFEVVTAGGNVVYTTRDKSAAETVATRYQGGTVRPKGRPAPAGTPAS